ncbi:hypothetical protein [Mycolicibacterium fluoranthenivorans]|nr:hypothetical protein [Mycolicibacterium fluoranthenivorans]
MRWRITAVHERRLCGPAERQGARYGGAFAADSAYVGMLIREDEFIEF